MIKSGSLVLYNPVYTKEVGIVKSIKNNTAYVQYNQGKTYPATNLQDLHEIKIEQLEQILDTLKNSNFGSYILENQKDL